MQSSTYKSHTASLRKLMPVRKPEGGMTKVTYGTLGCKVLDDSKTETCAITSNCKGRFYCISKSTYEPSLI
ncbi:hypothetical protein FF38_11761 [Lucilia cuprina]|uniref:Uncharacterized protein n=1 Tax=Lucilia cuprina TaxID=7375 RepID=A0A0L0CET3_LUCCU|nr:hypothetical protein FF38_11761 [Lucilia cuprina]